MWLSIVTLFTVVVTINGQNDPCRGSRMFCIGFKSNKHWFAADLKGAVADPLTQTGSCFTLEGSQLINTCDTSVVAWVVAATNGYTINYNMTVLMADKKGVQFSLRPDGPVGHATQLTIDYRSGREPVKAIKIPSRTTQYARNIFFLRTDVPVAPDAATDFTPFASPPQLVYTTGIGLAETVKLHDILLQVSAPILLVNTRARPFVNSGTKSYFVFGYPKDAMNNHISGARITGPPDLPPVITPPTNVPPTNVPVDPYVTDPDLVPDDLPLSDGPVSDDPEIQDTTTTKALKEGSKKLPIWAIVVIVLAALLFIVLICVCYRCCCRKAAPKGHPEKAHPPEPGVDSRSTMTTASTASAASAASKPKSTAGSTASKPMSQASGKTGSSLKPVRSRSRLRLK